MKKIRFLLLSLLLALCAADLTAKTYRAHDPAWRGVWLWQRKGSEKAQLVDMRAIMEEYPGSCELSTINRISGRGMAGGITDFYVRFVDTNGNLLYPAADRSRVLHFDNWGIDFGKFDYIRAWAEMGQRTGCKVVFVGPQEEQAAFKAKYPDYAVITVEQVPNALRGTRVNEDKLAARNLFHEEMEFRKTFTLAAAPKEAKVCLTATGLYDLQINGNTIGMDGDWMLSETYDVTPFLKVGENTIQVVVEPNDPLPGLILNSNITLPDGTLMTVDSDVTWQCRRTDGDRPWETPIPVGFEGAGPRFRMREVFHYPAPVMLPPKPVLLTAAKCSDLSADAAALLAGQGVSKEGAYEIRLSNKTTLREISFMRLGVNELRIYGRVAGQQEWRLLAAPFVKDKAGAWTYRAGIVHLPFSAVDVQEIKLTVATEAGASNVLRQLAIVTNEEE